MAARPHVGASIAEFSGFEDRKGCRDMYSDVEEEICESFVVAGPC